MSLPTEEVQELDSGLGSSKSCNQGVLVSAGDNTYSDTDEYSQLVPSIQKQSHKKWMQVMRGTVVLNPLTASDCAAGI